MPRIRLCRCKLESQKPGSKVYLKLEGVLTTNKAEANWRFKEPVGEIVNGPMVRLSPLVETALSVI